MGKALIALAAFVILSSLLSASNVSGIVHNVDNVNLPGTLIEVFQCGQLVSVMNAQAGGYYTFDLPDGDYIFRLARDGYPLKPILITVSGRTEYDVLMIQRTQQATVYGRVVSEKSLAGVKAYATLTGRVVGTSPVSECGDFAIPSLDEGEYVIIAKGGAFSQLNMSVYVQARSAVNVELKEKKETAPPVTPPVEPVVNETTLSAQDEVEQGTEITVSLRTNLGPLAGEAVEVRTPSGPGTLITNSRGEASINAAEAGVYVFTYKGISKSTLVKVKGIEPPVANVSGNETVPPKKDDGQKIIEAAALPFGVVLVAGAVVLVIIVLVALYFIARRKPKPPQAGMGYAPSQPPSAEVKIPPRHPHAPPHHPPLHRKLK